MIRVLASQLGVNRAVATTLLLRIWQAVAGPITLVLIAIWLTPVEQGFYYAFASVAALQIVFELGLSGVLVQVASHEFAGLQWSPDNRIIGEEQRQNRFLSLLRVALAWYAIAAVLMVAVLYPSGIWFFAQDAAQYGMPQWKTVWFVLVTMTALNLITVPVFSIMEGSGRLEEVYGVRIFQAVTGALGIWAVLALDGGILAVAMNAIAGAVIGWWWFLGKNKALMQRLLESRAAHSATAGPRWSWRNDVWPLQWRIGVSWVCGYILTQMHTPLLFRTQGAVVAGRMGITLTIGNVLGLMAMSWITSRAPSMGRLAAQRRWGALDAEFRFAFSRSVLIFALGMVLLIVARYVLDTTIYGERFLPLHETTGLLLALFASHIVGGIAAYLRAHKREPFMWPSIIGAVLIGVGAMWAAPQWSSAGVVAVIWVVSFGFGLPSAVWMWRNLRRRWHAVS